MRLQRSLKSLDGHGLNEWKSGRACRDAYLTGERIQALMDLLGNPEKSFQVIHVAGTNGKSINAWMRSRLGAIWVSGARARTASLRLPA